MIVFESRINEITRLASSHFRFLRTEAREEAVQNTLALCWKYWVRLVEQGKDGDEGVFSTMIYWLIKHTKMGRKPQGQGPKDLLDRHYGDVTAERIDLDSFVGRMATVPDIVAFRVDTQAFLSTLTPRNRTLSMDLASGMTTSEAATKFGVTAGAISQSRSRFKRLHSELLGEA